MISGVPQRAQNGAILLALSAWHLYPDLDSLSSAHPITIQGDPLIGALGVLTIGLEDSSLSDDPVAWSLPLAYMRYYGEPKLITGIAGHSNTRIPMELFAYIVLGTVISPWVNTGYVPDESSAMRILQNFSGFAKTTLTKPCNNTARDRPGFNQNSRHFAKTSWIGQLMHAVEAYEMMDETERSTAMKLIALGGRHENFLCPVLSHPAPLFGLTKYSIMLRLMTDSESRAAFFREYASSLGLAPDRYVIRYTTTSASGRESLVEYATIKPIECGPVQSDSFLKEGSTVTGRNIRWLSVPTTTQDHPCGCKNSCEASSASRMWRKRCKCSSTGCSLLCHDWRKMTPSKCGALCGYNQASRSAELLSRGEQCLPVHQRGFTEDSDEKTNMCDFGTGNDFAASMKDLYIGKFPCLKHGRRICSDV